MRGLSIGKVAEHGDVTCVLISLCHAGDHRGSQRDVQ